MQTVTVSTLKTFDALKDVPDAELQWLIDTCENRLIPEGELFVVPDQPLTGPHFIIDGHFTAYLVQNGNKREFATFGPGHITGYLPYSRGKVASVFIKSKEDVQLLSFPTDKIREMMKDHFEITQALVHVMSNRVREFTALQTQNEKMMALGKLSAGLAHELNNPASAIVRDTASLIEHLRREPKSFKKVIAIKMSAEQVDALNNELQKLLAVKDRPNLTLKEKTKQENEVTNWLEEHEIENGYDMAEIFVEFDFKGSTLDSLSEYIPEGYFSPVFNWISNLLTTEKMVEDIQESSRRIAELVTSVKNFTHMDRGADKQYANIHFGIKNTLTMLLYKIKKGNIEMAKDFDKTLPPVKALIGELNQVWTNLIDNALDAMEPNGKGVLSIKTEKDKEFVQVTIGDDGPGIPEEIRSRIFDPFFTTKEMGRGTGMGLDVVQRIVKQHNGSIKVQSQPGKTEFIVCFPIDG